MKFFKYLVFILLLYLFIYLPPFHFLGNFKVYYVLLLLSILTCLFKGKEIRRYLKQFSTELSLFFIILLFSVFRSGLHGDVGYVITHFVSVASIFFVIPFLIIAANKLGVDSEKDLIRALLIVSAIAGSISMICIVNPSFNDFIKNNVIQYDEEHYLSNTIIRGFGLANGLTSNYGYIQGSIVAIGLYWLKDNKWFLVFIPIVLLSALVNARTGVIIAAWGIILLILSSKKRLFIPITVASVLFVVFLPTIMELLHFNEYTILWIFDFVDKMDSISNGDMDSVSKFVDMVVTPHGFGDWILGRGINIYDQEGILHSDIGWCIQLYYGGVTYLFLLFIAFYSVFYRLFKLKSKFYFYFFLGVVILVNTKSRMFPSTGEFSLMLFVYYVTILTERGLISRT